MKKFTLAGLLGLVLMDQTLADVTYFTAPKQYICSRDARVSACHCIQWETNHFANEINFTGPCPNPAYLTFKSAAVKDTQGSATYFSFFGEKTLLVSAPTTSAVSAATEKGNWQPYSGYLICQMNANNCYFK